LHWLTRIIVTITIISIPAAEQMATVSCHEPPLLLDQVTLVPWVHSKNEEEVSVVMAA